MGYASVYNLLEVDGVNNQINRFPDLFYEMDTTFNNVDFGVVTSNQQSPQTVKQIGTVEKPTVNLFICAGFLQSFS